MFDPLKAAILYGRDGNIDEASWLVFLSTHFGRHRRAGWQLVRLVYGRLGDPHHWDWATISPDPASFRAWLHNHQNALQSQATGSGFGNHRKYESLDAYSGDGTGAAIESYVHWIDPPRSHQELFDGAYIRSAKDPRVAFDDLYHAMHAVASFGRTARFDYLTTLGYVGLASIEPKLAYLNQSTGPLRGARLLFGGNKTARIRPQELDTWLVALATDLGISMHEAEDALCNWQKSPRIFVRFRG